MKNKRKSNYQSADINIYCFPFVLNKQNEYLCFFRNENETKEFTTTKTKMFIEFNHLFMNVYRNQKTENSFIKLSNNNWKKK